MEILIWVLLKIINEDAVAHESFFKKKSKKLPSSFFQKNSSKSNVNALIFLPQPKKSKKYASTSKSQTAPKSRKTQKSALLPKFRASPFLTENFETSNFSKLARKIFFLVFLQLVNRVCSTTW